MLLTFTGFDSEFVAGASDVTVLTRSCDAALFP